MALAKEKSCSYLPRISMCLMLMFVLFISFLFLSCLVFSFLLSFLLSSPFSPFSSSFLFLVIDDEGITQNIRVNHITIREGYCVSFYIASAALRTRIERRELFGGRVVQHGGEFLILFPLYILIQSRKNSNIAMCRYYKKVLRYSLVTSTAKPIHKNEPISVRNFIILAKTQPNHFSLTKWFCVTLFGRC